ncbi:hypothetical protein IV203_037441 [Nitzschia inconspicua]|uniref:Uncharacterized protein n=1 Tax=Nitzschia inconspicua TaxID=303405 RepID=A0A9K3LLW7_9STRA|nr:hypothetical protein IV203_037441 [Nitzschia inconspicua]
MPYHPIWFIVISATAYSIGLPCSDAFTPHPQTLQESKRTVILVHQSQLQSSDELAAGAESSSLREQAKGLKARAERLRQEIIDQQQIARQTSPSTTFDEDLQVSNAVRSTTHTAVNSMPLPWSLESNEEDEGEEYRLYVDIGREEGTWMDARWGASGKRIPFTLDVKLLSNQLADAETAAKMVKDNNMGKSSKVYDLKTAPFARLRDGFDRMQCYGGAYRIDLGNNGQYTIRMMVKVEGTKADQNYMYGDVSIPKGYLYFSLPCFGGRINQLSSKEGPVTVRQVGWHTGWRRDESRIVGFFQTKPITIARRKDSY